MARTRFSSSNFQPAGLIDDQEEANPSSQVVSLSRSNTRRVTWSSGDNANWLSASPASGTMTTSAQVVVTVNTSGLAAGTYNGNVTIALRGEETYPFLSRSRSLRLRRRLQVERARQRRCRGMPTSRATLPDTGFMWVPPRGSMVHRSTWEKRWLMRWRT